MELLLAIAFEKVTAFAAVPATAGPVIVAVPLVVPSRLMRPLPSPTPPSDNEFEPFVTMPATAFVPCEPAPSTTELLVSPAAEVTSVEVGIVESCTACPPAPLTTFPLPSDAALVTTVGAEMTPVPVIGLGVTTIGAVAVMLTEPPPPLSTQLPAEQVYRFPFDWLT